MRKLTREYPSVSTWNYITIEGYCLLNDDYGICKDRYAYVLKKDGLFKRVKNDQYNPAMEPDPYPEGCLRSINSRCIECNYFGWCDPDDMPKNFRTKISYKKNPKKTRAGVPEKRI
jgi:hypothetical protein